MVSKETPKRTPAIPGGSPRKRRATDISGNSYHGRFGLVWDLVLVKVISGQPPLFFHQSSAPNHQPDGT